MFIVFIHECQVIEHTFLIYIHALQTIMYHNSQLITKARVIWNTVWNGTGQNMWMTILMLQTFTIQGSAACSCTQQETLSLRISCSPGNITDTLETEHGVIHVHRNHRQIISWIATSQCSPGTHGSSFVDTFLKHMPIFSFTVIHELFIIFWRILLTMRRIDT